MAGQQWRKFSPEFRRQAVEKMKQCDNVSALARELGVRRKFLYQWKEDFERAEKNPRPKVQAPATEVDKLKHRINELEELLGKQSLEIDFFEGALRRIEERQRKREENSVKASTNKSDS